MTSVLDGEQLFEVDMGEAQAPRPAAPAGEAKTFRRYDQNQCLLSPPSLDEWLPEDHEARFVSEVVENLLDLSPIQASYASAAGAPPYNPKMMLKLLMFAYATGVTSRRQLERRCFVDVALRWLSANEAPDYRSISRFRRRHLAALEDLFTQVLQCCAKAGLVRLGRVALDATKLDANASEHKAMSYDHVVAKIEQLEAEVKSLLEEAERVDVAEDEAFGCDRRGDELSAELSRRKSRLEKLRAAKEAIENEAREKAAAAARTKAEAAGTSEEEVDAVVKEAAARAKPKPSAQRSFTDPESPMMKTNHGFDYAYNAQAVVDDKSQVILAAEVTDEATDINQLVPMIKKTEKNLAAAGIDDTPDTYLADAGYCSEDNLARRLLTKKGRADYAARKAIVEPAIGQMKVRWHAGQLRLRGRNGVQGDRTLHAICHNMRKLIGVRSALGLGPATARKPGPQPRTWPPAASDTSFNPATTVIHDDNEPDRRGRPAGRFWPKLLVPVSRLRRAPE